MNIALVIERFNPQGGGAERSTAQIARELVARGHRVTVLAVAAVQSDGLPFEVRCVAPGYHVGVLRLVQFSRWVAQTLDNGGFDTSLSVTTAVPAAVLQPRSGTVRETLDRNVAMRSTSAARAIKRTLIALSIKHQMLLSMERKTLADRRVRRIVAVSRYVADQLERHYHVDAARIDVIPNAAVMEPVSPEQRQVWRTAIRHGFSIPDDVPAYLFPAHNPRLKGINELFKAIQLISHRNVLGIVMLAVPQEYIFQRTAEELGIRDRVRFVGPTANMAALYSAADVTVLPTHYDPSSKVVIESLMMGVPAISTGFNGASDFLTPPGVPGGQPRGRVVSDPTDVEALAQAMIDLADPAERGRCGAATAGLDESLSMRKHVDRLEMVLREAAL